MTLFNPNETAPLPALQRVSSPSSPSCQRVHIIVFSVFLLLVSLFTLPRLSLQADATAALESTASNSKASESSPQDETKQSTKTNGKKNINTKSRESTSTTELPSPESSEKEELKTKNLINHDAVWEALTVAPKDLSTPKAPVQNPHTDTTNLAEQKQPDILVADPAETVESTAVAQGIDANIRSLFASLKLSNVFIAILAVIGLILAIRLINTFFSRFQTHILNWLERHTVTPQFQRLEVLTPFRLMGFAAATLNIFRAILFLFVLYWFTALSFSIFPETQHITQLLIHYIFSIFQFFYASLIAFLPNAMTIIVIGVACFYLIRVTHYFATQIAFKRLAINGFHPDWAFPTYKILQFLFIIFALVMMFPYLPGFSSPAFQGVSVFFGILLSLGSSSAVANIIAGVVLLYMRPFRKGDFVKVGNTQGTIADMTLLVMRLKTPKNEMITLPNTMVLSGEMTNYSRRRSEKSKLVLHTTITIGYDIPWPKVHELLIAAAKKTEHVLESPDPFILQTSLDDFYVAYELNAYTEKPNIMPAIYSELHKHILDEFNAAGVEILSPHYRAIRDGGTMALPPEDLPADYTSPAIKIRQE